MLDARKLGRAERTLLMDRVLRETGASAADNLPLLQKMRERLCRRAGAALRCLAGRPVLRLRVAR